MTDLVILWWCHKHYDCFIHLAFISSNLVSNHVVKLKPNFKNFHLIRWNLAKCCKKKKFTKLLDSCPYSRKKIQIGIYQITFISHFDWRLGTETCNPSPHNHTHTTSLPSNYGVSKLWNYVNKSLMVFTITNTLHYMLLLMPRSMQKWMYEASGRARAHESTRFRTN